MRVTYARQKFKARIFVINLQKKRKRTPRAESFFVKIYYFVSSSTQKPPSGSYVIVISSFIF